MDTNRLIDGLIMYIGFVILLTFHEFGHAWMALKCGDDTAQSEGRVSLNPLVHIDLIGTVLIPATGIFMGVIGAVSGGFLIGWARPVPVNPNNLRNPRLDDILITLAGPWMNVLLAVALVGLARVGVMFNSEDVIVTFLKMAKLSLFLCFFNLLPIPPLDGSHIFRSIMGISYDAYYAFARYGFLILIVVMQYPPVQEFLQWLTRMSLETLVRLFGILSF